MGKCGWWQITCERLLVAWSSAALVPFTQMLCTIDLIVSATSWWVSFFSVLGNETKRSVIVLCEHYQSGLRNSESLSFFLLQSTCKSLPRTDWLPPAELGSGVRILHVSWHASRHLLLFLPRWHRNYTSASSLHPLLKCCLQKDDFCCFAAFEKGAK